MPSVPLPSVGTSVSTSPPSLLHPAFIPLSLSISLAPSFSLTSFQEWSQLTALWTGGVMKKHWECRPRSSPTCTATLLVHQRKWGGGGGDSVNKCLCVCKRWRNGGSRGEKKGSRGKNTLGGLNTSFSVSVCILQECVSDWVWILAPHVRFFFGRVGVWRKKKKTTSACVQVCVRCCFTCVQSPPASSLLSSHSRSFQASAWLPILPSVLLHPFMMRS